jgi:class 3 adenylate cyclase
MDTHPFESRQQTLAAIAFSDIVGFSARMGQDELHTLDLVERDFRQMTDLCEKFAGKVLKTTGDGLLMYFASAVQAVDCAREIQTEFAKAATTLPTKEVLAHRIGIHLGDVYFSETDVMGNGVNIAARLQAKAEVGGICISQTIYDVVKHCLELDVTYLGELELKNIQEPIPAYNVLIPFLTPPILGDRTDAPAKPPRAASQLSQQAYRDRQIILNKVRNFWVEGVLETSIHDKALIELGLQTRLDTIAHPWQMDWATSEEARKPLPTGTKAINQFDRLGTGRTLLILGDPGAGKTTTLLEITRELIVRAQRDSDLAMPIVFNLSSWQEKQSIADWMVLELNTKYQVPKKIGKAWVSAQQILPMLDGLDEVSSDRRNACVEAINRYHGDYVQTEIVVCSRMKDYEALAQRLQFQGAIFIQPLEEAQVYEYFDRLGSELEGVREMLTTDAKLLEMAKTPLMANIMAIAYRGMSVTDLIKMSLSEDHVQHLFDTYIDRMLRRRPDKRYEPRKVKRWLGFLARQLRNESQTVFLIEKIQPSWLQNSLQASLYAAAFITLISLPLRDVTFGFFLIQSLILGLTYGLMRERPRWWVSLLAFTSCFTIFSIAISASWHFGVTSAYTSSALSNVRIVSEGTTPFDGGISFAIAGLISGSIFVRFQKLMNSTQLSGFQSSLITIPFWFAYLSRGDFGRLITSMGYVLIFCIVYIVGNAILWRTLISSADPFKKYRWFWQKGGIEKEEVIPDSTTPNQGIIQSFKRILLLFLVIIGLCVTYAGAYNIIKSDGNSLKDILTAGMVGFVLTLLFAPFTSGGIVCTKHFILRILLFSSGKIPWNYGKFLNYSINCILLQKIGGGYIFAHRLLLEHFSKIDEEKILKPQLEKEIFRNF